MYYFNISHRNWIKKKTLEPFRQNIALGAKNVDENYPKFERKKNLLAINPCLKLYTNYTTL